jgi:hypothetical protein
VGALPSGAYTRSPPVGTPLAQHACAGRRVLASSGANFHPPKKRRVMRGGLACGSREVRHPLVLYGRQAVSGETGRSRREGHVDGSGPHRISVRNPRPALPFDCGASGRRRGAVTCPAQSCRSTRPVGSGPFSSNRSCGLAVCTRKDIWDGPAAQSPHRPMSSLAGAAEPLAPRDKLTQAFSNSNSA